MRVRFIEEQEIANEANRLLSKACIPESRYPVDVVSIATQQCGLQIYFEDLRGIFDDRTLGLLLKKERVILCDHSVEPCGKDRGVKEKVLRFTVAHEVGHDVFHDDYMDQNNPHLFHKNLNPKEKDRLEIQANLFAACLLMPQNMFIRAYHEIYEEEFNDYFIQERLSERFAVSRQAIEYRMEALNL